ncbi:unnamed protein product [Sphagnum tenellum]
MASVSLSDLSSLTFSSPFMIPTSKLPAENTSAIYAYGNVSQMSVSKPVSLPSPFFSHTELQSIADPEIKRNSSSVSFPAESLHNSPPKSLLIAGAPSSSISFTRKPVSTAGFEERLVRISKSEVLRAMAEYSVLENTMLVEDFNNQGQVVQKLNDDIVLLGEKVLAQEAMLKSLRAERDKAQQESSSAIGWSETLAGEVIALENRLCILQSHELQLKRDMESLTSDLDSYKQQIASLEKD